MILREMIDTVFSHNSLVTLCETDKENKHYSNDVWEGMAHEIPERFLNREATIFGVTGPSDGYINIHLGDKYIKPTVDKLLDYVRGVSYIYNYHLKNNEHVSNNFFLGTLEGIQFVAGNLLGLPCKINHDENGYITSISIGNKTVELKMRKQITRYDEITSMNVQAETKDTWKCQMCPYQNNKPTCYCVDCAEIPESLLVQKWLEQEVPTHEK